MTADAETDTAVLFERRNTSAWLTLNRPDTLNALNIEIVTQMNTALDRIEPDVGLRSVVITGAGRAFCVGADLKGAKARSESMDGGESGSDRFIGAINDMLSRIEAFPKPVIAGLNGMTLGAGLETALCCDIIIARTDAKIGDGHARFGLLPGGGSSARLPRRVGAAAAKWMLFSGDFQTPDTLLGWGLLQAVYPEGRFESGIQALCDRIGERSPLALSRMKRLANEALTKSLEEALAAEQQMLKAHMTSNDRAEGLAAFAEKRQPVFTGT